MLKLRNKKPFKSLLIASNQPIVTGEIQSPMGVASVEFIDPKEPVAIVSILSAGLALAEHAASVLPATKTYHLASKEKIFAAWVSLSRSAERFDPREHSWSKIGSMNTKRGCHSLAVLNEKIYAVGGYDGSEMVPSMEIYDPRLNSWITGEPMNQSRGYSAAAVFKEMIYVIGGVKAGVDVVDIVECYEEGKGWQVTNLKAGGKRCFSSAIVL